MVAAFAHARADYCTIVTPSWIHRPCVELACKHDMHILMEKPIADSWKDVVGVHRAVKRARVKCTMIQNYRIDAHLKWLGGGPRPETVLADNIYSNATLFAAIEASQKSKTVNVEAMVEKALKIRT